MKISQLLERTLYVDSSFVQKEINDNYDELVEAESFKELVARLNQIFAPYDIKFIGHDLKDEDETLFRSNTFLDLGYLEAEIFNTGEIAVHVFDRLFEKTFKSDRDIKTFIAILSGAIRHELVHREQFRRSRGKAATPYVNTKHKNLSTFQQYIADPKELYAMAFETIEELQKQNISKDQIIEELKKRRSHILLKSNRYASIFEQFIQNDKFKVIPRFKSLIYQILTQQTK